MRYKLTLWQELLNVPISIVDCLKTWCIVSVGGHISWPLGGEGRLLEEVEEQELLGEFSIFPRGELGEAFGRKVWDRKSGGYLPKKKSPQFSWCRKVRQKLE